MDKQPLVFIILLNYNGYKDTIECIESLEKIIYKNYKIIVVDNASTDESEKILKCKFPKHIFIQTGKNLGFAGGNNIGIKYAIDNGAEYVLLLNNDTVVKIDFLEYLIKAHIEGDNVGISIGKIYYHSEPNKIWYAGGYISKFRGNAYHIGIDEIDVGKYDKTKYIDFATGCTQLISVKAIKDVGFMEEDYFLYYEDTDYCCKFSRNGYKIVYEPKSIIWHKVSSSTGIKSELTEYYVTRNRLIYIHRNFSLLYKAVSFVLFCFVRITKAFVGKQRNKVVFKAFVDYIKYKNKRKGNNKYNY